MTAKNREIQSAWTRPRKQTREQPALSREQIIAAAIELLNTEGLEALSMRKLGARLNAGATSLYTHVANKDELIELVVDEALGQLREADPADPRGWRAAVLDFANDLRALILGQPWLASVIGELGTLYLGPNAMRGNEQVLAVFEEAGFEMSQADRAMNVVFAYVVGNSVVEAASLNAIRRRGLTEDEWFAQIMPAATEAASSYPRLRKRYAALVAGGPALDNDKTFNYEVGLILDGLDYARRKRD